MSEYTFTVDGAGYRKRWSLNTFPEMVAVLVALGEIPESAVDKLMEMTRKWTPAEQVKLVEEMREQAAEPIRVEGKP